MSVRSSNYRCVPLLVVVIAIILMTPLMQAGVALRVTIGIAWAAAFGFASYLVFPARSWLKIYVILVALLIVAGLLQPAYPSSSAIALAAPIMAMAVHCVAFYAILRHALLAKVPNELDRTVAAIAGYFLLALIWMRVFQVIALLDPKAFAEGDGWVAGGAEHTFAYFSLISLTTVGYGDITPVNDYARLLGGIEGAVGTLYIAVVIASLIGRLMSNSAGRNLS